MPRRNSHCSGVSWIHLPWWVSIAAFGTEMSTHWPFSPANASRGTIAAATAKARKRLFNMRTSLRSDALVGCFPLLTNLPIVLSPTDASQKPRTYRNLFKQELCQARTGIREDRGCERQGALVPGVFNSEPSAYYVGEKSHRARVVRGFVVWSPHHRAKMPASQSCVLMARPEGPRGGDSEDGADQTHRSSARYWRVTFDNPPLNLMGPEFVLEFREIMTASRPIKS